MNLPKRNNSFKEDYDKTLLNFLETEYLPKYKKTFHSENNFFCNVYQDFGNDENCISFVNVIEKNKNKIKKELNLSNEDLQDPYSISPITYAGGMNYISVMENENENKMELD